MTPPLADAWAKFYRAYTHTQTLESDISIWVKRQGNIPPYRREFKFHPGEGRFVWKVTSVPELPVGWGVIAGDALTNFRAALDYVAWQLVKAGTTPHPPHPERIYFPIHQAEAGFDGNVNQRLPGVDTQFRAYVEYYQPYRQRPNDPASDPLAILAELSRRDKHRQLQLAFPGNMQFNATLVKVEHFAPDRIELPQRTGVVQVGSELVYVYGTPTPNQQPNIELSLTATMSIAFEEGHWVKETFQAITSHIHAVLTTCEMLL